MSLKNERLKKLELELQDLQHWLKLGLVPKKDIEKHREEIQSIESKIVEEKERLKFLKENGELEEFVTPKKSPQKQIYPEVHTLPDMDMGVDQMTESGMDLETDSYESETQFTETGDDRTIFDEDDDPFSDKNRWKRGILEDPDSDSW